MNIRKSVQIVVRCFESIRKTGSGHRSSNGYVYSWIECHKYDILINDYNITINDIALIKSILECEFQNKEERFSDWGVYPNDEDRNYICDISSHIDRLNEQSSSTVFCQGNVENCKCNFRDLSNNVDDIFTCEQYDLSRYYNILENLKFQSLLDVVRSNHFRNISLGDKLLSLLYNDMIAVNEIIPNLYVLQDKDFFVAVNNNGYDRIRHRDCSNIWYTCYPNGWVDIDKCETKQYQYDFLCVASRYKSPLDGLISENKEKRKSCYPLDIALLSDNNELLLTLINKNAVKLSDYMAIALLDKLLSLNNDITRSVLENIDGVNNKIINGCHYNIITDETIQKIRHLVSMAKIRLSKVLKSQYVDYIVKRIIVLRNSFDLNFLLDFFDIEGLDMSEEKVYLSWRRNNYESNVKIWKGDDVPDYIIEACRKIVFRLGSNLYQIRNMIRFWGGAIVNCKPFSIFESDILEIYDATFAKNILYSDRESFKSIIKGYYEK